MLLPLLFVLLTAFGGATAFGLAMKERRRRDLPAPSTRPALTSGSGDDSLLERSIRELRPGDILTIIAPSTADTTLADLGIALAATR